MSRRIASGWLIAALATVLANSAAHADYLGFASGRPASIKEHKDLSIDLGLEFSHEYQTTAVRINRKFGKKWIGHASLGIAGRRSSDATPISVGAMYSLTDDREFRKKFRERFEEFGKNWNLGVRASAGFATFDNDGRSLASSALTATIIASSRVSRRSERKLKWFTELGLLIESRESLRDANIESETRLRPAISAGMIHPFLVIGDNAYGNLYGGEVFGGLTARDGITFSAGMRFNFK